MNRLLKGSVLSLLVLMPLVGGCVKSSAPSVETTGIPRPTTPIGTDWPTQGPRPYGILGLPMPVTLSQEDKDRISFVARSSSSFLQVDVTSFQWYAIVWAASSVPATVWVVDEQTAAKGIPSYVNPNALWYPGVTLTRVVGNITYQAQVAYDYDSERKVYSSGDFVPVN